MNGLSSQSGLKNFLVKLLQRKTIAGFVTVVIGRYIGYYPRLYLQLNITGIIYPLIFDIRIHILDTSHIGRWNYIATQIEIQYSDNGCRNHIRHKQPLETDTARQHGYNLGVVGQLGGKKYNSDKSKQRTKQIGKIGKKIEKIVEYRRRQRRFQK